MDSLCEKTNASAEMHELPRDDDSRRKHRQGLVRASKNMLVVTRMSACGQKKSNKLLGR
ncbi:hypothetical protein Poly41_69810 [Novipirellula artificiosorum]|uniref:Uncharacterized protein n=1 Tax=Novipirellula artificiosorum TaxID=2528016 RepID=A0A5C6CZA6_9BACT|nr:hypothetical protein Poly41_69810 [Novipirellula artificiosorum]